MRLFALPALPAALGGGLALWAVLAVPAGAASVRLDPAKTVGPEACAKCHDREYEVWRGTAHARLFQSDQPLHLRPAAQEIGRKLGVHLIKHDSLCLNCHFTPKLLSGKVTARAGVSCESCHGAAQGWLTVHNTFEGRQADRKAESTEQRRRRQERNFQAGMLAGGRIYDLVSRCYGCHFVPEERLVDEGGHTAGGGFDLVSRFEQIRHDFVTGGRRANAEITPERRRQLYVLGLALELEYGLRGVADAREAGTYAESQARNVEKARKKIRKAERLAALPQLEAALAASDGLRLEPGNATEVGYAVAKVAAAARSFAEQEDGSRLAALDPLLRPAPEEPAPEPTPEQAAAADEAPALEAPEGEATAPGAASAAGTAASAVPGKGGGRPVPGGGPAPGAKTAPGSPAARAGGAAGPAGAVKAHLRSPLAAGRVIGQERCSSCHGRENGKWYKTEHQKSADPFLERAAANLRIATLYYGKPAGDLMATGRAVCMDCHGTVVGGQEAEEVESGVSCESCHGPAGRYRDTHKDKKSRAERLATGIVDLERPELWAGTCAGCHYVTDPRLLASGHPQGRGFDVVARSREIEHWSAPPDAGALRAAWQRAVAARGPVPQVQVAKLGTEPPSSASTVAAPRQPGRSPGLPPPPRPYRPRSGPAVRAAGSAAAPGAISLAGGSQEPEPELGPEPGPAPGARPIALPSLPGGIESRSVEEILLQVERRLAQLYEQTGG